jgi:hypothetical protein
MKRATTQLKISRPPQRQTVEHELSTAKRSPTALLTRTQNVLDAIQECERRSCGA